ncbi:class I SAM-dependent methyltransferase [Paenibacillus sp. KN14-4R]|uniref:class I SAM-dependent methyltransferase n=1 Tax=Paenibacillus sp. KN14-4R TaxID=3445773 RepID=UPI003F9FF697
MKKEKLVSIFDKQAIKYENRKEGKSLPQWRQKLLQDARGHVLELAVGAGANFPFYPPEVKVTATDFSGEMLKKAQEAAKGTRLQVDFILSDIDELGFDDHSFDTIVSTLSFCCYGDPLEVLNKLHRWCKPDGQILLLEHGISSNWGILAAQKLLDPLLYRYIGCHHTRNYPDLLQASKLSISKMESYWFDMVKLIWVKPTQEEIKKH